MNFSNVISCLSAILVCDISFAIPVYEMRWDAEGTREYVPADSDHQSPAAGFRAYDNYRTPDRGGNTNYDLATRYRMGGHEVADELFMVTTAPSIFTDFAFSIANTSATQRLQSVRLVNRIYDENRVLLFADDRIINIGIAAGGAILIFSDSNVYLRYGVVLPPHIFVSMQFISAVGVDVADVGCLVVGPRTTGYSDQFAHNFTTGQTIDFNGSDQSNMAFFVDTAQVPSPSAATVFCLSALPVVRRRRR